MLHSSKEKEGMKMKKIITIDPKNCMGCWNCLLGCAWVHSKSEKMVDIFHDPNIEWRLSIEEVGDIIVPLHCQHCDDAPCSKVCPTGALKKQKEGEEDIILYDESLCIGCKMCLQACPFGMIKLKVDGCGIVKCDLCIDRLKEGLEPACVSVCITDAIKFEPADIYVKTKQKENAKKILSDGSN